MSVVRITQTAQKFIGLSGDTKPTDSSIPAGATFFEEDTGFISTFDGTVWQLAGPASPLVALNLTLSLWKEMQETMLALLDEARATRIALTEFVNAGTSDQTDFLEMSQLVRDANEEA